MNSHNTTIMSLADIEAAKLKAYESHHWSVKAATSVADENLVNELMRLAALLDQAKRYDNGEAIVLVRERVSGGPLLTVYHRADNPCGRVGKQPTSKWTQMLEMEAVTQGLAYCDACSQRSVVIGSDHRPPLGPRGARAKYNTWTAANEAANGRAKASV